MKCSDGNHVMNGDTTCVCGYMKALATMKIVTASGNQA